MHAAESIRKLGFRRWYERQLIESHAYLVTAFLCMILFVATLEVFDLRGQLAQAAIKIAVAFGAGALGLYAFGRYKVILEAAERFGENATCPQCHAYGRFVVTSFGERQVADAHSQEDNPMVEPWLSARCRKCSHEWTI